MYKQQKYTETTEYYTLKMKDGWHIVKKVERNPPVTYDFEFMIVEDEKHARAICDSLNTGRPKHARSE
jgi:hypothetical protein